MVKAEHAKIELKGKGGKTERTVRLSDLFEYDDLPIGFGEDRDFTIRYDATEERFKIRDEDNGNDLFCIDKNVPFQRVQIIPIIFETAQTGLAADSTGVKFTSQSIIPPTEALRYQYGIAVEATWTASDTDSVTAVEIYDEDAASVVTSVSGNTGTDSKSSTASITAGNSLVVRVNVTTASATTGATTDVNKAVLYLRFDMD